VNYFAARSDRDEQVPIRQGIAQVMLLAPFLRDAERASEYADPRLPRLIAVHSSCVSCAMSVRSVSERKKSRAKHRQHADDGVGRPRNEAVQSGRAANMPTRSFGTASSRPSGTRSST
jgi:ribosomal protein S26